MNNMFLYCNYLKDLDLTSFNFRNKDLLFMFEGFFLNIKIKEEFKELLNKKISHISFLTSLHLNVN